MDAKLVFDTLNAHREHYRVLPSNARSSLLSLISMAEAELDQPHAEPIALDADKPRAKRSKGKGKN